MSAPEPRFCAFVVISGQGLGRPAFRKESWSGITAPLFVIGGSADRSPVSDDAPEARKDPYLYAASARKYLMFIEGATHGSYAGKSVVRVLGEKPPANLDYITGVVAAGTTAFLDSTLKRDPAAARFLDSEALPNLPGGKMEYRHP
jgi:predicted dienelactone hydrolase